MYCLLKNFPLKLVKFPQKQFKILMNLFKNLVKIPIHCVSTKYTLGWGRSNVVRACYRNIVNRIVLMEYNLFSFRHKKKLLLPLNLSNFYFYSFFYLLPCAKLLPAQGTTTAQSFTIAFFEWCHQDFWLWQRNWPCRPSE